MPDFDPEKELAELAELQAEMRALLTSPPALLGLVRPARSGWSAEQHLAHVALANELVLKNLASLASTKGLLLVRGGEPHPLARELLRAGRLPRGEAQAPRMVRPPERVERALLEQWLEDGERARAALDPTRLAPGEHKIPHQLLGPLDAPEWARFAVVHTRHHLLIVRELLAEG
jgi:hypothetical protein